MKSERASGIVPAVLRWARERAGYSVEDVARRMKKESSDIEAWETGAGAPTYVQLEKLAYEVYKRPVAIFYFPEPPQEEQPQRRFRRLPAEEFATLEPDTLYALREARARQLDLMELTGGVNPAERKIFDDVQLSYHEDAPIDAAAQVREYLGVTVDEQSAWGSYDEALKEWRRRVQDAGIWVFKRSFKQSDVAGFCYVHDELPIIYMNNSQLKVRQIFTLFHELAHVLLGFDHIERSDVRHYLRFLEGEDHQKELACNRFANEFLVPTDDFVGHAAAWERDDDSFDFLSRRYFVSREVILRKYRDRGWVDSSFYRDTVERWRSEREGGEDRPSGQGGNFYHTKATYLGEKYLELAFRGYYRGSYGLEELASYLDVKANQVIGLESSLDRAMGVE